MRVAIVTFDGFNEIAAHYLATWMIWIGAGRQAAVDALSYVLPHGEEDAYTHRALGHVAPFVDAALTRGRP
jgi:hypothetical protein